MLRIAFKNLEEVGIETDDYNILTVDGKLTCLVFKMGGVKTLFSPNIYPYTAGDLIDRLKGAKWFTLDVDGIVKSSYEVENYQVAVWEDFVWVHTELTSYMRDYLIREVSVGEQLLRAHDNRVSNPSPASKPKNDVRLEHLAAELHTLNEILALHFSKKEKDFSGYGSLMDALREMYE